MKDKFGFQISTRPGEGYAYNTVGEHQGTFSALAKYFALNETVMIEVVLRRRVMEGLFRLTTGLTPEPFPEQPKGNPIP